MRNFMARNFLAGDILPHAVTFTYFMAGQFLAGHFLTRIHAGQYHPDNILGIGKKVVAEPFGLGRYHFLPWG